MRNIILAILTVILIVGAAAWILFNLRTKEKYALVRDEWAKASCSVKAMDEATHALLTTARTEWIEVSSQVGGPHSQGLEAIGLHASVEDLVQVCAYQMPEYSFVFPSRNKRAVLRGLSQITILSPAADKSLHVSDDGHVAVLRAAVPMGVL